MTAILQVCQNGARGPGDHPGLPLTPEALAADFAACLAAGAAEAHFHPRGADGLETVTDAGIADAVAAVRPLGAPFGVSTREGIAPPADMAAAIAGWSAKPDYASVNLWEAAAPAVRRALAEAGIACEAGVWSPEDAARLADGPKPFRILVEMETGDPEEALRRADATLAALDRVDTKTPRLLHGLDGSAWPVLRRAQALGLSTRIGFEDVLTGEDGAPVAANADLIRQALEGAP